MTASMNDPDPDPKAEAARLAYLEAEAAADAHYAGACAANGGIAPDTGTEAGWAAYTLEHETEAAYDQYLDAWHQARTPQAEAAGDPDMEAGL